MRKWNVLEKKNGSWGHRQGDKMKIESLVAGFLAIRTVFRTRIVSARMDCGLGDEEKLQDVT